MTDSPQDLGCYFDGDAIRRRLIDLILAAPAGARQPLLDLILSVRTSLDALGSRPAAPEQDRPVADWTDLLGLLASYRRTLDSAKAARIESLRRAHPNYAVLERRFQLLRQAYEFNSLMIEIMFELINAGQEFQTASDILEQSAEILLKELGSCLFVCRLRRDDDEDLWENIAANSLGESSTPIFVKYMEETLPNHPVMHAVHEHPETMYVLSNNLRSSERGGESFDCVPYQEGYRSRLSFILRDEKGRAFGLIMLYSKKRDYFQKFEGQFLADCARIVSLTVGRRMDVGRDALAKAAGGMAHVGNNVLATIMNYAYIVIDEMESASRAASRLREKLEALARGDAVCQPEQLREGVTACIGFLDGLDADKKIEYLNNINLNVNRLKRAIMNLQSAVDRPVIMPYVRGEEVLDLEAPVESLFARLLKAQPAPWAPDQAEEE